MEAQNVSLEGKTILVTGGAGFIGARLSQLLLERIHPVRVVVLDELNDYYDPRLKHWRLEQLRHTADRYAAQGSRFAFVRGSIADERLVRRTFADYAPAVVVNLAAQAGVRYSIDHPDAYIESNLVRFLRKLEAIPQTHEGGGPRVDHLVYASSSTVYGSNTKLPYSTEDKTDSPVSLYAATKKSDELLACAYAGLYRIPATGLRFFTVYGPAGRPDMAYFKFTDCLRRGERIPLYNYGSCMRDFTYVDDIVEGILRVMTCAPAVASAPEGASAPHRVYNIGNSQPVKLLDFVRTLQQELIREELLPQDHDLAAHTELLPMQPGDVLATYADTSPLERDFGFRPATPLREGLRRFARWYRAFYGPQSRDNSRTRPPDIINLQERGDPLCQNPGSFTVCFRCCCACACWQVCCLPMHWPRTRRLRDPLS